MTLNIEENEDDAIFAHLINTVEEYLQHNYKDVNKENYNYRS